VTRQEAIDETLRIMEPYLKQDSLNDAQAARIGRTLYANLRQAERDNKKHWVCKNGHGFKAPLFLECPICNMPLTLKERE
jgi:hypothetical protein